ncbi:MULTISPECIES: FAD/NAD(P)-binding protein [Stenotrophomonas]|uniref:FAD/NAD(P)-binding protein n=1 Tax=Stenotrophomonas TaxID=40323 RepID=UPI00089E02BF|nr:MULTISPECIES: FAD/NAD(P)-binding protein [Stenotrophomonas]AOX64264.1 pyridine nucleotide-disulfide oxidoreductase [Stenotrophomonas sp. LM091]MCX2918607.1 FAD/NAD(P)-binding protein [Stenotrophomonas rhizophila]
MAYNRGMTASDTHRQCDLAIVGGGAAGVLVALQALRHAERPSRIVLFEPASVLAEGIAYATPWPEHLLNVPAGKMSGLPDQPADFLDYLIDSEAIADVPREVLAEQFVPRRHYAAYLRQRLEQARERSVAVLEVVEQPVFALVPHAQGVQLRLDDDVTWSAQRVVLACGNSMRPLPVPGADALPPAQAVEAWDYDGVRVLAGDDDLAIIGSGLSMADSVVALAAAGHRGRIFVLSRHALLPLPQAHGASVTFDPQPLLAMSLRQRMRELRAQADAAVARGIPWQSVMDRIRPMGQALWLSLSEADQRRFLRHVVRYWDVHRHRIAESVHAQVAELERRGQLQRHRARLDTLLVQESGLQLHGRSPDGGLPPLTVAAVINATGVETRALSMRNPLIRQLLADGHARPGPHGLGLDTTEEEGGLIDGRGQPQPAIRVVGSLRIGTLWESLAIPELRVQAEQAARRSLG